MKNFRVFLVETLLQLTILVSISRYQTNDSNRFEELLQKSLIEFERYNFIQDQQGNNNNIYNPYHKDFDFDFEQYLPLSPKDFSEFDQRLPPSIKDSLTFNSEKTNNYIRDIIQHNTNNNNNNNNNRQQFQIYLNPFNFLRVTDKFLEYPELQTKNSLADLYNNANISPEDMDAIKKILFEQDIDVGVERSFYDPEYRTSQFEKNYTNKDDIDYLLQTAKSNILKTAKSFQDDDDIIPGFQKIIEEDTGEVFLIPIEPTVKADIPVEIVAPKLMPDAELQTFNPATLERFTSNKTGEIDIDLNDNFFDDLFDVKIDDAWLKNFMEPANIQSPIGDNINFTAAFNITDGKQNTTNIIIQPQDPIINTQPLIDLSTGESLVVSQVQNEELAYMHDIIENMLANDTGKYVGNNLTEGVENMINSDLESIDQPANETQEEPEDIKEIDLIDDDSNLSSAILSDNSMESGLLQTQFKEEATSDDALYGFMHNHTYLVTKSEDVYHPHSYKNKLKNALNATNRETKDEALLHDYKIEHSLDTIVNSNVEVFTELLKDPKLTADQINLMKDIRRRGKNKIAAKTCRKRKIDSIDNLKEDVDELRKKKKMLEQEREKIQEQMKEFAMKIDSIYKNLTGSSQDPSDPIKNYIENLLKELNEKTGDAKSNGKSDNSTPKNNKRK